MWEPIGSARARCRQRRIGEESGRRHRRRPGVSGPHARPNPVCPPGATAKPHHLSAVFASACQRAVTPSDQPTMCRIPRNHLLEVELQAEFHGSRRDHRRRNHPAPQLLDLELTRAIGDRCPGLFDQDRLAASTVTPGSTAPEVSGTPRRSTPRIARRRLRRSPGPGRSRSRRFGTSACGATIPAQTG